MWAKASRASCRRVAIGERAVGRELGEDALVGGRRDHHPHVGVVLRRSPDHGRSPDVDELDGRIGAEGIEVADHQIDEADALPLEVGQMVGLGPVGQDPAVDGGVQGLDPPAEHLGGAGELGHLEVGDARLGQRRRCPPAGDQLPTQGVQPAGQFDHTGLVVDGK